MTEIITIIVMVIIASLIRNYVYPSSEVNSPQKILNEYKSFFATELQKNEKLITTKYFEIVLDAVKQGEFDFLELKKLKGLSSPSEKIAITLIDYLKDVKEGEEKTLLILALSYLYKPQEQFEQRMMDNHITKEAMTPEQIEKARELAKNWQLTN